MQDLLLGIDICDDYSQISYFNPQTLEAETLGITEEEASCMVPTVICKEKGTDSWSSGLTPIAAPFTGRVPWWISW